MTQDEKFSREYALKRNTINLFGEIDTVMAEYVISQLQYLDDRFKTENIPEKDRIITIQIDSPGGSVTDGFAIYDTMQYIDAKVATVGIGLAASMGAFLLAGGTKGMRSCTENCEVLIHQPLGGAAGQATEIILAADHIKRTRDRLNRILAENTGKTIRQIAKDTDRDNAMTAEQACAYGLIDMVLSKCNKED